MQTLAEYSLERDRERERQRGGGGGEEEEEEGEADIYREQFADEINMHVL